MGESPACLRRSISYPPNASRELKEGDPLRALTDSISFGRFMQESLAWEKWSSFSHNRRLEEVENLSKPGSVAQKKAFFEAYYKKKAAAKAAAEAEEVATFEAIQTESAHDSQSSSPTSLPKESMNGTKSVGEESERVASADTGRGSPSSENSLVTQNSCSTDVLKENVSHHVPIDKHDQMYTSAAGVASPANTSGVKSSSGKRSSEIQGVCSDILHKESANNHLLLEEEYASASDGAHSADAVVNSSLDKACTVVIISDENEMTMVQQNQSKDMSVLVKDFKDNGDREDQKENTEVQGCKLPAEKTVVHEIPNPGSKKDQAQSTKPLSRLRASKIPLPSAKWMTSKKSNNVAQVEKKSIRKPVEKKKSMNALHMSINISSGAARKSNALVFQPVENTKAHTTSVQKSEDGSNRLLNPTTESISGMLRQPLITPRSKERRSRRLLSQSISQLTMNARSQTLSTESPKSSAVRGSNARSSFLSAPFKFRTEERAAKRKEKIEEKIKTKEAENTQVQTRVKVEHDPKTLRQSTHFKARPIKEPNNRNLTSIKEMKKIPEPPPKPKRKTIASTVQEASLRPPQRTLTTEDSSRCTLNRHTHKRACIVTSLTRENRHENTSPNLQR